MTFTLPQVFGLFGLNFFGSMILIGLILVAIVAILVFLMRGGFSLALFMGGFLMFALASMGGVFLVFYVLGLLCVGGAIALFFLKVG